MAQKVKIFISSVAEDSLKSLRENMFERFRQLGHDPEMYEKNFGPWGSDRDGMQNCLDKVEKCEIYCLLIGRKGGTFVEKKQRTITHLEFIKALEKNKYCMLFCEKSVKEDFFKKVNPIIYEFKKNYEKTEGKKPQLVEILSYLNNSHKVLLDSLETDTYVWVFLDDIINEKGKYVEDLSLGVTIEWSEYLSDILRKGVSLIPFKETYESNYILANKLLEYQIFLDKIFKLINIKGVSRWGRLLALARIYLRPLEVKHDFGNTYEKIGDIKNCIAICVFHKENNKLRCIQFDGDTDGDSELDLTDPKSLVVNTYNSAGDEKLRVCFEEDKHILYCMYKVKEYVISYYFEVGMEWNVDIFKNHSEEVCNSMLVENVMVFNLLNIILKGI